MSTKIENILQAGVITKLITLLFTLIMITSVFTVEAADDQSITKTFSFSAPTFETEGDVLRITQTAGDGVTSLPGAPELAVIRGHEWLPTGASYINVDFDYFGTETGQLELPLVPSPVPQPLLLPGSPLNPTIETYEYIYDSHEPYGTPFTYDIGYGINPEGQLSHVVTYEITPMWLTDPANNAYEYMTGQANLQITWTMESTLELAEETEFYDLLIICADAYVNDLQPLVAHKEDMGLKTKLVSLADIYAQTYFEVPESIPYQRDNAEKIKYFIYQAKKEWSTVDDNLFVMAVGGYRTFFGLNVPSKQFPMRYVEDKRGDEPGYMSDQYFSCFLGPSKKFDDWDKNGNGIFGESIDTHDIFPDVIWGRLACRNRIEVRNMVQKIITYETETYGQPWFQKMLTITGDGFQDQVNLGISWNVNSLPDGDYTIFAQSELYSNSDVKGPIDQVNVTVDHAAISRVTFSEEDHLKIKPVDEEQEAQYPALPVAEITSPSDGDILGTTDVDYVPSEAYIGDNWARVEYHSGYMTIRGKSYDPTPKDDIGTFESKTRYRLWVEDKNGNVVLAPQVRTSTMYYEGEMECQEALDFMPDYDEVTGEGFIETKLWSSNGQWTGMGDVIEAISDGHGFVYFAGHGNPMSWGDHLPGIPGGRDDGMINGLKNLNLDFGLARYESDEGDPLFPMDHLTNGDQQSIVMIGGCHNSFIDASFMKMFMDPEVVLFSILHGGWVPECFAWWLIRMPQGGGIGSIGNSGLGYGYLGEYCLNGLGGWVSSHFFRSYAIHGKDTLGEAFTRTLEDFANGQAPFGFDLKTFEAWILLGDPSLKIGGYEPDTGATRALADDVELGDIKCDQTRVYCNITNNMNDNLTYFTWSIAIQGASPLGRYFGLTGTIFEEILRGKVLSGGLTSEYVIRLREDETLEIASSSAFGIGHIDVNVSVTWEDEGEDQLLYKTEDGFLLGSRIYLYHPEE